MKKKISFIIEIIIGIIFICFGYFVIDTDYYATLFYAMGFGLAFAYGHFPRPSGPRSPARQGHIKRPVLRLAEPSFLRPANQCC